MPAKKLVTKRQIFDAAFKLLSEKGATAINARSIAKELGCSTQPIYLAYSGMTELTKELLAECKAALGQYFADEKQDSFFLSQFVAYARFAYEKPMLFRYVYFDNAYEDTESDRGYQRYSIEQIMKAGGYDEDVATRFYFEAWMFMHGVAAQLAFGFIKLNWDDVLTLANDQFLALKQYYGAMTNKK